LGELLKIGPAPEYDLTKLKVINESLSQWSPREILGALGESKHESETLVRLIIACAIIEGPQRLEELLIQIDRLCVGHLPHLNAKLKDKTYRQLGPEVKELVSILAAPRQPLQFVRARIANIRADARVRFTDYDLNIILYYGRHCISSYLIGTSRNVTAAKDMLRIFSKPPSLLDAEEWKDRLLPAGKKSRALLFEPKDYGRVVVVLSNGSLMYDPIRSSVASG